MADNLQNNSAQPSAKATAEAPAAAERARLWPPVLLAFALLALGFLVLGLLLSWRQARFLGRPEVYLERFLADTDAAALIGAASGDLDFTVTEFEDAAAIFDAYRQSLPAAGALQWERESGDAQEAVFAVRADGVRICRVTLRPGAKRLGFGQHDWEVAYVSSGELQPQLESVRVRLRCLAGDSILLNGRTVGEEYLTNAALRIPDLSAVERRGGASPHLEEYTVGPLYGAIRVTDSAGQTLAPRRAGDTLLYESLPEARWSLDVSAPRSVTVYVNGEALRPEDVLDSGAGLLAGFAEHGEPEPVDHYRFDGLYRAPEVTALGASGEELTPICPSEGRWVFFDGEDREELRQAAEDFLRSYLDYVAVSGGRQYVDLLRRIAPDTALYRYVAESAQAMVWAPKTTVDFQVLRAGNIRTLGEDCFTCTAEYAADTEGRYWTGVNAAHREKAYELVFLLQDAVWRCAAMQEIR